MSHELRTPLNAVIGFSDVLLERMFGELNERQEEYVRDIRDSGRHLLDLINEILDLSKVEAGRMELEPAALSLPELLEQGLSLVRDRAARQRLTVELEVAPEVGVVWADEVKLKQVVVNLLTNAVKFTPEGGASTSPRGSPATRSRSTCATPASASRTPTRSASSRPSSAATGASASRGPVSA